VFPNILRNIFPVFISHENQLLVSRPEEILRIAREKARYTQAEISEKLGISSRHYQNIEEGKFPKFKGDIIKSIDKLLNLHLYEIIYEQKVPREVGHLELQEDQPAYFQDHKTRSRSIRLNLKHGSKPIPVFNGKASAGSIQLVNDEPEVILGYIDYPEIGRTDGTAEVVGHSMYPTFSNGTRVAIKKVEDFDMLVPGNYYWYIDKEFNGYVKRLGRKMKEGIVTWFSDNPDQDKFPPYDIKLSKVLAVFKVVADVNKR